MAIVIKSAPQYLIWESDGKSWRVSRLDGKVDDYVKTAKILLDNHGIGHAKKFFVENGLTVEVHPLDDDLKNFPLLLDTFFFRKESEYAAS